MPQNIVTIDHGFEITDRSGYKFRIVKHFPTRRSKIHTGWDLLVPMNDGWHRPQYFSHFHTLRAAKAWTRIV